MATDEQQRGQLKDRQDQIDFLSSELEKVSRSVTLKHSMTLFDPKLAPW